MTNDDSPLADLQPLIREMRDAAALESDTKPGAYAVGHNRKTHESYLFGYDADDRDFALRFTPPEFRVFAERVNVVLALLDEQTG